MSGAGFRGNKFGKLADLDEERAEGLADFVVKFAGDRAALLLLGFDEAGGEAFEFKTAAGESLKTLVALASRRRMYQPLTSDIRMPAMSARATIQRMRVSSA